MKNIGPHLEILEDASSSLSLAEVMSPEQAGRWRQGHSEAYSFGQTESSFWLRFTTEGSPTPQELLLVYRKGFINEVDFYLQDPDGSYEHFELRHSRFNRPLAQDYRYPVLNLKLGAEPRTHYLRIKRNIALNVELTLWQARAFTDHVISELWIIGIFYGVLLAMIFYNAFLYAQVRVRYYLYYIFYVMALGAFQLWFDEFLFQFGWAREYNPLPSVLMGLSAFWFSVFSFSFLSPGPRSRLGASIKAMAGLSILIGLSGFIFGSRAQYFVSLMGVVVVASSGIIWGVAAMVRGNKAARLYLLAMVPPCLGISLLTLRTLGLPLSDSSYFPYVMPAGITAQLIIFALALGDRMQIENQASRAAINRLNDELEAKVRERTAQNTALLRYIPQGILSLGPGGVIEPSFSDKLVEILGVDDIAGHSFKTLFLDRTLLLEDEMDQAWQAIQASVGEPVLAFEINENKLPRSLQYQREGSILTLALTWNVEVGDDDQCKRILVTIMNITEEIQAKRLLEAKNRDFAMIQELVEAGPRATARFFAAARHLLSECQQLVSEATIDREAVRLIFMNCHTLKGSARTLYFRELSNSLHAAESELELLLKEVGPWDSLVIQKMLEPSLNCFKEYLRIDRDVLGHGDTLSTVILERSFSEDFVSLLGQIEKGDWLPASLRKRIAPCRAHLFGLVFQDFQHLLDEFRGYVEKIAKDLGKEKPVLNMNASGIYLTYDQEIMIRNVLIHIVRNCLDHGIETAEQRRAQGKSPEGRIDIEATARAGRVFVTIKDDGAGLNISKLEDLGRGRLAKGSTSRHEDIAQLVFDQGISTATTVSEYSGRGVGMGAVRRHLEEQGGAVTIHLLERLPGPGIRYRFQFELEFSNCDAFMHDLEAIPLRGDATA